MATHSKTRRAVQRLRRLARRRREVALKKAREGTTASPSLSASLPEAASTREGASLPEAAFPLEGASPPEGASPVEGAAPLQADENRIVPDGTL
jgi:hypothetical protein